MNLAVNARDAMPRGGHLTIETGNQEIEAAEIPGLPLTRPGPYVMISISDTGTGMDAQTQARIFEPFLTTRDFGRGTGLGLATVYEIVHQAGGFIRVNSEPGRGTTFRVYLPRMAAPAQDDTAAPAAPPVIAEAAHGSETVLIVDDEAPLRVATRRLLERFGYHVLEAEGGETAIALAERHDGPIHLLLTDVVMPGLSGRDVALAIRAKRPDIKVLFVSGYADGAVTDQGATLPGPAYLQKPYSVNSLGHKVREVLDARQS